MHRRWCIINKTLYLPDRHATVLACRFEQVIISPSAEPAAVLLSQRPVDRLQLMTAADVADGLAGDAMHTICVFIVQSTCERSVLLPEVTCINFTAGNSQCNANMLQLHLFDAICQQAL